ncbi:MAG: PQQ-binding-like beta-propeller repeat protein [Spirochaetota bacterium]
MEEYVLKNKIYRLLLFFLLILFVGIKSEPSRNEFAYRERVANSISRVKGRPIRRFYKKSLKAHQLAIEVGYKGLKLSEKDLEKYSHLSRNNVLRIDYVTHRCRNDVLTVNRTVDRQRIDALYRFNKDFFKNKKISWGRIVQTGCQFDYQALKWFHGFVLTLELSPDGIRNFTKERLSFAKKMEYKEGDITDEVRAFNSNPLVKMKKKFSPGKVSKYKFDPTWKKKTSYGYIISFPSKKYIPVPIICSNSLFVSGGFNSYTYFGLVPKTGKKKWSIRLSDKGPSAAACGNGVLVFNTESCTLFAISTKSGQHIWSYYLGTLLLSTPSVHKGIAYAVYPAGNYPQNKDKNKITPTHILAAFQLKTGKVLWQKWIDSDIIFAPVISQNRLYVASLSGILYEFGLKNGKIYKASRNRLTSAPVVTEKFLYYGKRLDI